jgi:transcriptional regulator with XRE-family HTH domain
MPRNLQFAETAPEAVREAAVRLGGRVRLARTRRRVTLRELAARAGIAYDTARAVEEGGLQTGLGAYLAVIWALGLEADLAHWLDPDRDFEGKQLDLARTPLRVRRKGTRVGDDDF